MRHSANRFTALQSQPPLRLRRPRAVAAAQPPPSPAILPMRPVVCIGMPSPREMAVLRAIATYYRTTGSPPSTRDVADVVGLTPPSVFQAFSRLVGRGCISRRAHVARSTLISPLGRLIVDGFVFGAPEGQDAAMVIDVDMARWMRCGACHKRGLSFIALHRGDEYGAIVRCQVAACGYMEAA